MGYQGGRIDNGRGQLNSHPNYQMKPPQDNESPIEFALRNAAHLVSPQQVEGECEAIECTYVRDQIIRLKDGLEKLWSSQ